MNAAQILRQLKRGVSARWGGSGGATDAGNAIADAYTSAFFDEYAQRSLRSARVILREVFKYVDTRSAVDVGCGRGTWLRAATELDVRRVLGIDGDYVDRRTLLIPPDAFVGCSLEVDFADVVAVRQHGRFDIAFCMEVAEHLRKDYAWTFVERLTALSDVVLFSAAVPFQGGVCHVNEQWPEFWALLFDGQGYECFDCIRRAVWENAHVDWWYAQNVLLFVRRGSNVIERLPRNRPMPLTMVHPCNYLCRAAASGPAFFEEWRGLSRAWSQARQ